MVMSGRTNTIGTIGIIDILYHTEFGARCYHHKLHCGYPFSARNVLSLIAWLAQQQADCGEISRGDRSRPE